MLDVSSEEKSERPWKLSAAHLQQQKMLSDSHGHFLWVPELQMSKSKREQQSFFYLSIRLPLWFPVCVSQWLEKEVAVWLA